MRDARQIAVGVLLRISNTSRPRNLQSTLGRALNKGELSQRDRNLAAEIVYGVLRHRLMLDSIIAAFSSRPLDRLDAKVIEILRVGLYQVLFLERVPDRAAVNESVQLCKRLRIASASAFVNAVLRQVLRSLRFTDDAEGVPETRTVRVNGRWAVFSRDVFPPSEQTVGHISRVYSHPEWMVARWVERFGRERTISICKANNSVPPIYIRTNTLLTTRDELKRRLEREGVKARPGNLPCSIRLENPGRIDELKCFSEGLFVVQDESAMRAALLLKPEPGQRVLDLCAAPGGKTTHLAELMNDEGEIVAVDSSAERLRMLEENCRRLGLKSVRIVQSDVLSLELDGGFDRILLDAPCSNTGVLRRRPDAKWRLKAEDIRQLAELQKELLNRAVALLKPGGMLLYSTCSIEREENEDVVRGCRGVRVMEEVFMLPGQTDADGGYLCLIVGRR